jgi:predicted transcriptional regulator
MKREYMTVRIDEELKRKVALMAKKERRGFSDQVLFLMEKGLAALERRERPPAAGEERE